MAGESIDLVAEILANEHSLARAVADLWVKYDGGRSKWKDRVKDVTRNVFAESTRDTDNGANFENSTHRPKITQIYDNLVANYVSGLMPNKNWLRLENETQHSFENLDQRKAVLAFLTTKHRISKFAGVIWDLVDDWVLYGNAFALVYYSDEKGNEDNPFAAYESSYRGPRVKRISPFDIVFNPIASTFEKSPKIIRSLSSMGELIRDAQDNPEDGWSLDVVDQLRADRQQFAQIPADAIDKNSQMVIDGFGSYSSYVTSDTVEILELYGNIYDTTTGEFLRDYVVTVVDRRYVVRSMPLKSWTGKPRIHHAGWRKRKDNLWAMGPLDNLVGLQFRINHLENAKSDAFDDMIYGDIIVTGNVDVQEDEDGSRTYIVSEGGSVGRFAPDTTILNADLQIRELQDAMELYSGSPREASGFRTPGEKTKFEVSTLTTAASRIFQHKMAKFEAELLEPVINSEIAASYEGMRGAESVRSDQEEDGLPAFVDVTKDDLLISGRIVPIGARHFARQAQLSGDLMSLSNVMAGDEALKQHFSSLKLGQLWASVLDAEEFDIFEPYVRVDEIAESNRRMNAVQVQAQNEAAAQDDSELGVEPQ